jgi:hypothetical protein
MSGDEDRAREERVRDFEEHDLERAQAFVRSRAELAEKIYSQAINSLWLSNSGAALATLSFIGAAWKNGGFPKTLLWPLGLFIAGMIFMGIGTLVALLRERSVVARNQQAQSILDIYSQDIWSPLERTGLSSGDWRARMALCSGICFVAGCVAGFVLLALKAS